MDGSSVGPLAPIVPGNLHFGLDTSGNNLVLKVPGTISSLHSTRGQLFWETYIPFDYQEGENPPLVVNAQFTPGPKAAVTYSGRITAGVTAITDTGQTNGQELIIASNNAPLAVTPTVFTFPINGTHLKAGSRLKIYIQLTINANNSDMTGASAQINSASYEDTYLTLQD